MKSILIFICACISYTEVHAQIITTIAGNDVWTGGFSGDNGPATLAELHQPIGITSDMYNNIYISDELNLRIRKIDTNGVITTFAGNGVAGYRGEDSLATVAEFCDMAYLKIGNDNCLYIPDICNNRIRKIDLTTNIITTFAGNGTLGFHEDGLLATNAQVSYPYGITFDYSGNLYFGDGSNWVHKINSTGIISRVAGSDSIGGYGGDGGPATNALLNHPVDIAIDNYNNIYISDLANAVIRKIDPIGIITTYAGDTVWGYYGDGGPATLARLSGPEGIAVDGAGNVFFADENNSVIRRIDHLTNIITTIAGSDAAGFSGDGGVATNAKLNSPAGIAFDAAGNLYIADVYNNKIRKVTNAGVPVGVQRNSAEKQEVSVYPNPVTNWVNIERVNGDDIRILDILGRLLDRLTMTATKNTVVMDVSTLQKGMYFVEITNKETGVKTVRKVQKE